MLFRSPTAPPGIGHRRRRGPLIIGALVALVLVGVLTAAIVLGTRDNSSAAGGTFSQAATKTAIQDYLDALQKRDIDTIARNMLCGLYDAVRDRRSDQALARLSSDAFRKQFSQAEVTSIDKVVYLSNLQSQVLFSMQVKLANGGRTRDQLQGTAQLLSNHGQLLVCAYVVRSAGTY